MSQDMSFQEKRMLELMSQLPQNKSADGYDSVVPVVEFEFSDHPNPSKARRYNIQHALKALTPVKRWFALPGFSFVPFFGRTRFKYNTAQYRCVVDGADCRHLDYGDLFGEYFYDDNHKPRSFQPWSGVIPGKGFQMAGTYCPQHLNLYHMLNEWIEQEAIESDKGFFKRMQKKGVAFIPIKKMQPKASHPLIVKWEQAFIEAQKDGLPIMHYQNPGNHCPNCGHIWGAGENDLTFIGFDNRVLKTTMPQGTTMAGTALETPHEDQIEAFEE